MRICLVCHSARGLVGGNTGGAERQVGFLARSFAARGHVVSLVVPGLREQPGTFDGVRLLSGWDHERGLRVARAVTYRAPLLRRVLVEQRADLYYVRGRAAFTPVVMMAARAAGAVSVLGLANDRDLLPDLDRLPYGLGDGPLAAPAGRLEYQYFLRGAIKAADWIVTQHQGQEELCEQLGLRNVLIPNIVQLPDDGGLEEARAGEPAYDAVWMGNVHKDDRRRKGLDQLVALTSQAPDVRFAVIGRLSAAGARDAVAALDAQPNVAVLGVLDHAAALRIVAASRVVLNTSAWEGLSNVMLEGWALGRPSVTLTVDPNELLSTGRLGATGGGDLQVMQAALRRLLDDGDEREAMGRRAVDYVAQTHGAAAIAASYETLVAVGGRAEEPPR
jgi:glycosyltransferase involved in cell wall biosynthesis